jgi:hypothetical protein
VEKYGGEYGKDDGDASRNEVGWNLKAEKSALARRMPPSVSFSRGVSVGEEETVALWN